MVVLELHVQMIDEQCTQFTQNVDHNKPCLWIRCSVLCVHLQVRTCTYRYIHLQKYPCTAYSQELLKFYCLIVVNYAFQLVSTLSRVAQLISLVAHTRTHTHTVIT